VASAEEPAGRVTAVVFCLDGKTLAAADHGGNITFYDLKLQNREKLLAHNTGIRALALTGSSRSRAVLASGGYDGVVKFWHVDTGVQLGGLLNNVAVYSLGFSEDGQALAAGMADGTVKLWRIRGKDRVIRLE